MSLRLRQLHLRAQTGEGLYGTRIAFPDGLVILRADNTMGKSTCIQAIIYALGLEKMLGPSNAIPLAHVMTDYLQNGQREVPVLESEVWLEIENHHGALLTIQRSVLGPRDTRLVSTWAAALLTHPDIQAAKRDYYVRDRGAAQNEAGFSRKLAEFIGWELPIVRKFNGSECLLYLETIFPLFMVEQKHGWSGIQANLPTYFGIRDMAKRSVEFVLNLDAAQLAEKQQRLEQEENELKVRWKNLIQVALATLRPINGRILGLPEQPTAQWPLPATPTIEVFRNGSWITAENALASDKTPSTLDTSPVPTAAAAAPAAGEQLEAAQKLLAERELVAGELLQELLQEKLQRTSAETRLAALREDLRRNKDALKLRSFGSDAGWQIIEHICPTCQQQLVDTLLPQGPIENPMSLDENITFIESQIRTFQHLRDNSASLMARKESEVASFRSEMDTLRAQIRSLRQTLIAPSSTPSIEAVRARLEVEGRIRSFERAISDFSEALEAFAELAIRWRSLLEQKRNLPSDGFSAGDKIKLGRLKALLREQLKNFGFSSLDPEAIEISMETYRPTIEGFDLGFDLSASDNVRTIWAYLQGLLELSAEYPMNHLGLLVFDEPRQQEAAEWSFERLLQRAALAKRRAQQIVFATSEPLANIQRMTADLGVNIVSFEGRVVSKLQQP